MSIYALKPRFQDLLRPLVARLQGAGVTANQVTLTACALSAALGGLLLAVPAAKLFLLVPAWLFLRMALNAADGMLAREFGQSSALGAYLNEICDVVSDAALYAPFAFLPGTPPWLMAMLILLAVVAEFAGVLGVMVGGERRYDGPMGKSDRAFLFGAVALLVGVGVPLAGILPFVWTIVCVLIAWTIVNRIRAGLRSVSRSEADEEKPDA